jgi:hypothetical protein
LKENPKRLKLLDSFLKLATMPDKIHDDPIAQGGVHVVHLPWAIFFQPYGLFLFALIRAIRVKEFRVFGVVRGSPHPAFRLHRKTARQVSAIELNSFQHLTTRKISIMQKCKLGNLEVSAIGLGCMSGQYLTL